MRSPNFSIIRKIWRLLSPAERKSGLLLLMLMVIGMALETLGVGLVVPALGLLTQPDEMQNIPAIQPLLQRLGNPGQSTLVVGGVLALVLVYLIKSLFLALLVWRQARLAFDVQAQLSQRLFHLYLDQPYTFHLQRNSAQLIRNAMNEVAQFTGNAMTPSMVLLSELLVVAGLCTLLLLLEPIGALVVVCVLGSAAWAFHHLTRRHILRWGKERLYHDGLRIQHLQQGLGGAKDVKLLGREKEFLEQYRQHNVKSARAGQMQKTLQQLPRLWLEFLAVAGLAALVIAMLVQDRPLENILPTLGLFAAAAFRLMPSVNRIISAVQSLRYGLPVVDTLHKEVLLNTRKDEEDTTALPFQDELQMNAVAYTYPGSSTLSLSGLSIRIHRGEAVGIIGPSGAGKSTLVDVLLGLLAPDRGEVTIDGTNVQTRLRGWQCQIGYVPQTIFLTDDTLRRNIAFGLSESEIDDSAVNEAIQAAQLEDFVNGLPQRLETLVGERGIRLSGGQRQRIGIARALYHDPAVLVLDEATSSLDNATESGVMQAVRRLQGRKTVIIVAHRLSTVSGCDRVYRIENGAVTETGSALEVLATSDRG